jgi:hypothetical protein
MTGAGREGRPELVRVALAWLGQQWQGDVYVPDELLPLFTVA